MDMEYVVEKIDSFVGAEEETLFSICKNSNLIIEEARFAAACLLMASESNERKA